MPNEDAHRVGQSNGRSIIAVADGHGSPACERADRGSQFAVDALFQVLGNEIEAGCSDIGQHLVEYWRELVEADLDEDPPNQGERSSLAPDYLLYGTTAIGVAADDTTITIVQIGDGDVLLGAQQSQTVRRPIPSREVDRPGATESLCQLDAAARVLVSTIETASNPVDAVLIATDGLDTAFAEDAWHDETMTDLLGRMVNAPSPSDISDALQSWCESPAAVGGDDTTIGLLIHPTLWPDQNGEIFSEEE